MYAGRVDPAFTPYLGFLAVHPNDFMKDVELQYAMVNMAGPWIPFGAGMVLRRSLAEKYREELETNPGDMVLDRQGSQSVQGGGDTELAMMCLGWSMACGVSSKMKFKHLIPAWRTDKKYFLKLLYSSNYGTARLLIKHGWKKEKKAPPYPLIDKIKVFMLKFRKVSLETQCWKAQRKGYLDGLWGLPFNPDYR